MVCRTIRNIYHTTQILMIVLVFEILGPFFLICLTTWLLSYTSWRIFLAVTFLWSWTTSWTWTLSQLPNLFVRPSFAFHFFHISIFSGPRDICLFCVFRTSFRLAKIKDSSISDCRMSIKFTCSLKLWPEKLHWHFVATPLSFFAADLF